MTPGMRCLCDDCLPPADVVWNTDLRPVESSSSLRSISSSRHHGLSRAKSTFPMRYMDLRNQKTKRVTRFQISLDTGLIYNRSCLFQRYSEIFNHSPSLTILHPPFPHPPTPLPPTHTYMHTYIHEYKNTSDCPAGHHTF